MTRVARDATYAEKTAFTASKKAQETTRNLGTSEPVDGRKFNGQNREKSS